MLEYNYLTIVVAIMLLELDFNEKSNTSTQHLVDCESTAKSGDYAKLVKFLGLGEYLKPNEEQQSMLLLPNCSYVHRDMKPQSSPLMCTRCPIPSIGINILLSRQQ